MSVTKPPCSVEGCERPKVAGGWCSGHYQQVKKWGSIQGPLRPQRIAGPCMVDGCPDPRRGHGYCNKHYQRWKQHGGSVAPTNAAGMTLRERVEFYADMSGGPDSCWTWTGELDKGGYGSIHARAMPTRLAHRLSYMAFVGPIPDGMHLDHTCHDPATCRAGAKCPHRRCVNPDHLEPVTPAENVARCGSVFGENMRKTHCPKGHPYSGTNLYLTKRGRACRTCRLANDARMNARRATKKVA